MAQTIRFCSLLIHSVVKQIFNGMSVKSLSKPRGSSFTQNLVVKETQGSSAPQVKREALEECIQFVALNSRGFCSVASGDLRRPGVDVWLPRAGCGFGGNLCMRSLSRMPSRHVLMLS